jgi:hypothetical protein
MDHVKHIKFHKLCIKNVLLLLNPDSTIIKLHNIKWQLNNGSTYNDLSGRDKFFLSFYFNITNDSLFRNKFFGYLKDADNTFLK